MADYIAPLNPWANAGDITAPDTSKINLGWIPSEQPPAPWLNWMTNRGDAKINQTVDFVNLLVGPISIPTPEGSKLIYQPPTLSGAKWTGLSFLSTTKTVYDQLNVSEQMSDLALDQSAQMFPALRVQGENVQMLNNTLDVTKTRVRYAPWTDPKNAHATSGNFFSLHTKSPWRIRIATHESARVLVSGYRQDGAGASAVMIKFSDPNFGGGFELTYADFLAKAQLPADPPGIDITYLELEDFVLDNTYIYIQVSYENPAVPGNYVLWITKLRHIDESFDFDTLNWSTVKQGAGGIFTRDATGDNNKQVRHQLEYLGNDRIVSCANLVRPANASAAVLRTLSTGIGSVVSESDSVLPASDYRIENICGDGTWVFCAITQFATNNRTIGATTINSLGTLNPNFPVAPASNANMSANMVCDGHFVYYFQRTIDDDDMLVMKADSGYFASAGVDAYIGVGLNPTIAAAVSDGTALWLLLHQTSAPSGSHVTLCRLDPTAIFPGAQYLKDVQRRSFFIDTAVSTDPTFFGDVDYTGREILITWDQKNVGTDKGKLARFANSNNR